MNRDEKMLLIQRLLGLKHKIKVHDSMKSPESHDELSASLLNRWELEDELKAIEILLEKTRAEAVQAKMKLVEAEYLSGKPRPSKKP